MSIITYPLNGIEYSAENAETYLCTRTSGVFSEYNNFEVSVTNDRQVTIGKGLAWIKNSDSSGKSIYNDGNAIVDIPIADGTQNRIDRIIIRFDKSLNKSEILVKQGTPSNSAVAPSIERSEVVYELGLYTVYVAAGSTVVSIKDITSTILDESVCGIMRDGVTGIPTSQIQAQAELLLSDLRDAISRVVSGSDSMLKTKYDPDEDGVISEENGGTGHKSLKNVSVGSAYKLSVKRTIALSGGATGTATSFDGSANITIPVTNLDVSKASEGVLPVARGGTGKTSLENVTVGTAQNLKMANYGTPIEVGQYIDMHKIDSASDHDIRLYININDALFLANPNLKDQQGYLLVNPDGNVLAVKKLTQSQYDSLSIKSSTTIYLIVG